MNDVQQDEGCVPVEGAPVRRGWRAYLPTIYFAVIAVIAVASLTGALWAFFTVCHRFGWWQEIETGPILETGLTLAAAPIVLSFVLILLTEAVCLALRFHYWRVDRRNR